MKVLILGATGGTGQQLVKHALNQGLDVNVLVRSPDKFKITQSGEAKLEVFTGNVVETDDVTKAMTGCEAVISALGGKAGPMTPCDVYSKSCDVIVKVMKDLKISRLIACTAWGTKDEPDLPFVWRWVLRPGPLRNVVTDMSLFEDKLVQEVGQSINWTVVKPPRLGDGPATRVAPFTQEGQLVSGKKNLISRADLAAFMLSCLTTDAWNGKLVAVAGCMDKNAATEQAESGEKK